MSITLSTRKLMHYQIKRLLKELSPTGFEAFKRLFHLIAKGVVSLKLVPITKIAWKSFPQYPNDRELAIQKISARRTYLAKYILANSDGLDICEVGIFAGINLWHLLNQNPNVKVSGSDLTLRSIRYARRLIKSSFPFSNLRVYKSSDPFNDPRVLASKTILLDAVVLYLSPMQIKNLIRKCLEADVSSLVLSDLSFAGATSEFNGHYYEHDIVNILNSFPGITFSVDIHYKNHWEQDPWRHHGILTTIRFS